MKILSIRLNELEYDSLKNYSDSHSISMNQALKEAFFEKFEDEYDIECFDKAYAKYLKDKKTYDLDNVKDLMS